LRAGPEEAEAPLAEVPLAELPLAELPLAAVLPPDETDPAPPTAADFVDGEMSGSFAPLAAATTQQQAIRVRKVRMGVQK
jgi:hypothetical protein